MMSRLQEVLYIDKNSRQYRRIDVCCSHSVLYYTFKRENSKSLFFDFIASLSIFFFIYKYVYKVLAFYQESLICFDTMIAMTSMFLFSF